MDAHQLSVSVSPEFLCEQSDPEQGVWAWTYTVTLRNTGSLAAQLVARHWVIMDAGGRVEEVRGVGVIGQQPRLLPGEAFEYTSWTRLSTSSGSMRGSYSCVGDDGTRFEVDIPEFALRGPGATLH